MIQIIDVHKSYTKDHETIKGVSFEVHEGQIFGLLGPNGAGKTTLMQMLGCTTPVRDYSAGRWLWNSEKRDLMIFSSYSNRAMIYDEAIYEMNRSGVVYNYDLEGKKIKQIPSAALLKQFLEELSRFSR